MMVFVVVQAAADTDAVIHPERSQQCLGGAVAVVEVAPDSEEVSAAVGIVDEKDQKNMIDPIGVTEAVADLQEMDHTNEDCSQTETE